jgi:hypothetical protein
VLSLTDHTSGAGTLFVKRFKEAVAMREKHQDLFAKFSETFKPETIAKWEAAVKAWEADSTKPNPYKEPVNGKV